MKKFSEDPGALNPLGGALGCFGLWSCLPTNFVNAADAVYPVANLAIYIPVRVTVPMTIANIGIGNGTAVAGNTDVGIYSVDGVRIVSSGSTAQTGTSTVQLFDITNTLIGPGMYYLAVAHDEAATGQILRYTFSTGALMGQVIGLAEETSAFPLPATATFASFTNNFLPVIGCGTKGSGLI